MGKKRITYFDMVKGLAIILVVLGHIEYISDPLRIWISSFHMPVFFVVSGMLIRYKDEASAGLSDSVKKKARGILIPYFWFSVLYFFIDIINVFRCEITSVTFTRDIVDSLTGYGVSVLWFLPALFLSEVFFLFLTKKLKPYISIPLIVILAIASYLVQQLTLDLTGPHGTTMIVTIFLDILRVFLRGFIATVFIMIAYYTFPLINKREGFSATELLIGIVMFLVNLVLSQLNGCVDFHYIVENDVPLFYLCALLGSYSLILICKNCKYLKPIGFFGKNSLVVMATHVNTYVLYAAILLSWQIDRIVTRAKSYIFIFNIMAITFIFEAIIIVIINKFFPFVLGKKIRNKE